MNLRDVGERSNMASSPAQESSRSDEESSMFKSDLLRLISKSKLAKN